MTYNNDDLLLSICIPTRGRKEILMNTLNSIYSENVDFRLFEVVIYDSSDKPELNSFLQDSFAYPNLIYKHGANYGFLNLVKVLDYGRAPFLKLHNDYSLLIEGSLQKMVNLVRENIENKPLLFFANGVLDRQDISTYGNFNDFMFDVSYFSSWSTAFGIWQHDLNEKRNIDIDPMFPHTSMLTSMDSKRCFVIDNRAIFLNQQVNKKGGYNLFKTFAVDFLKLIENCFETGKISKKTFSHIKYQLFSKFLVAWYCDTKLVKNEYTFVLTEIRSSIKVYYSDSFYYSMIFLAHLWSFYKRLKTSFRSILASFNLGKRS